MTGWPPGWGPDGPLPYPQPRRSAGETVVRVVAAALGVPALLMALLFAAMVVVEQFHPGPEGLGMMFAILLGFGAGLVAAAVLPFALPRRYWLRGFAGSGLAFVLAIAVLVGTGEYAGRHHRWHPPGELSLPTAFGARVTDGKLRIWTGSRCGDVTFVGLAFDENTAILQLDSTGSGGPAVEHLTLGGPYPPGLRVSMALPDGFDWRTQRRLALTIYATPAGHDATTDLSTVIAESAAHPDDTYYFAGVGWLDPAGVAARDGKTFLATCTPDPAPPR